MFNNQPVASEARTRQLTKILQYLKSKNCSPRSFTPKRLSIDQWGRWLQICDRLNLDDDSEIFSLISLSEELTGEFIDTLDPNISGLNEPDLYALHRSVTLFPEDPNWRALADRTFQRFQQHSGNPELDSLYTLVFTLLLALDRGDTDDLRSVVSSEYFWDALHGKEFFCLNYLALIYIADKGSSDLPYNADVKIFWDNKHDPEICDQTLRFAEALSCTDEIWHLANAGMAHAKQIILQGESEDLFSREVGAKHLDKLSEGDFDESEIEYIAKKLIKFGSFRGILSEIRNDPVTYKKIISIFHKYGDQETRNATQEILKTMSAENWTELIQSDDELLQIIPDSSATFTDAYQALLINLVSNPHSEADSELLRLLPSVKTKLIGFDTDFSVNVLRSYFDTSADFLTKKDFEVLIPNLIHALGRVDETNYQNRLCTWLEARRFFRIAATFSTKVTGIDMFASTQLGLFRAQLTDKMQTVSDGEETSDDIQQLEHLQAKLNEVTEAGDRRDNT